MAAVILVPVLMMVALGVQNSISASRSPSEHLLSPLPRNYTMANTRAFRLGSNPAQQSEFKQRVYVIRPSVATDSPDHSSEFVDALTNNGWSKGSNSHAAIRPGAGVTVMDFNQTQEWKAKIQMAKDQEWVEKHAQDGDVLVIAL